MTCEPAKITRPRKRTLRAAAVASPRVLVLIIVCAVTRQIVNKFTNAENSLIYERRACEALASDLERLQRVSLLPAPAFDAARASGPLLTFGLVGDGEKDRAKVDQELERLWYVETCRRQLCTC